jgi:hypothetical protein
MSIAKRASLLMIIATLAAWLGGCGQPTQTTRDVALSEGRMARNVAVSQVTDGRMQVEYRSSRRVKNGCEIQTEMRELWNSFLKAESERLRARAVLIWPEDETRTSTSFEYVRASDTQLVWTEAGGFAHCKD